MSISLSFQASSFSLDIGEDENKEEEEEEKNILILIRNHEPELGAVPIPNLSGRDLRELRKLDVQALNANDEYRIVENLAAPTPESS